MKKLKLITVTVLLAAFCLPRPMMRSLASTAPSPSPVIKAIRVFLVAFHYQALSNLNGQVFHVPVQGPTGVTYSSIDDANVGNTEAPLAPFLLKLTDTWTAPVSNGL